MTLSYLYPKDEKKEKEKKEDKEEVDPKIEKRIKELNEWRWKIHDAYLEKLTPLPQFTALAFIHRQGGQQARGNEIPDLAEKAREALRLSAESRTKTTHYISNLRMGKKTWTAEEIVVRDALAKNDRTSIDQLASELKPKGSIGRSVAKHLTSLADLYFSDPSKFPEIFSRSFSDGQYQSGTVSGSASNLLLRTLEAKKFKADELSQICLSIAKKEKKSRNSYPNNAAHATLLDLIYDESPEKFQKLITEMTLLFCGSHEERAKEKNENKLQQFAYFFQQISNNEKLVFPTLEAQKRRRFPGEIGHRFLTGAKPIAPRTSFLN